MVVNNVKKGGKMPLISIIVSVYDVELYIHRCIDSILAQTFIDFELILVDDGSPDNSGGICDEYAKCDERVSVIHKQNGGLSSARNAGIEAAKGEYLVFVDSDDVIHPQFLQILYCAFEKSNVDIAMGRLCRFKDDTDLQKMQMVQDVFFNYCNGLEILNCLFDKEEFIPIFVSVCGKLFKRRLFEEIRFPEGRLFEDEFITYRLYYLANMVGFIDKNMYYYFVNASGITQNLSIQKRFDEYDAQWERLEFLRSQQLKSLYDKALLRFLKTAQWDLIACRNKSQLYDTLKGRHFEWQYKSVLEFAKKRKIVNFRHNYDYYVLAYPKKVPFYRIARLFLKLLKQWQ